MGKLVVGISTLAFVFIVLTGVLMWLTNRKKPLMKSLRISFTQGWFRFWHDLHLAGGLYATLLLLLMALTGLTWSFGWYRSGFLAFFGLKMWQVKALHLGNWGGEFIRLLSFLSALVGATLPLTGYYLWIRRLLRKKTGAKGPQ